MTTANLSESAAGADTQAGKSLAKRLINPFGVAMYWQKQSIDYAVQRFAAHRHAAVEAATKEITFRWENASLALTEALETANDLRAQLAAKAEALEILTQGYTAKTAEVERLRDALSLELRDNANVQACSGFSGMWRLLDAQKARITAALALPEGKAAP